MGSRKPETVFVVWDPLYERVMGTHRSEDGAQRKIEKLNEQYDRYNGHTYRIEFDEFPLEG